LPPNDVLGARNDECGVKARGAMPSAVAISSSSSDGPPASSATIRCACAPPVMPAPALPAGRGMRNDSPHRHGIVPKAGLAHARPRAAMAEPARGRRIERLPAIVAEQRDRAPLDHAARACSVRLVIDGKPDEVHGADAVAHGVLNPAIIHLRQGRKVLPSPRRDYPSLGGSVGISAIIPALMTVMGVRKHRTTSPSLHRRRLIST
jgi:hypothetical protein